MKHKHVHRQKIMVGLALTLGLVFAMSLLAGLALARGPGGREAGAPRIGAPASILATASITGRVTDGTGTPLAGIWVNIFDGVSKVYLASTNADANGYYSATVTAPYDKVKVQFSDWGWVYATEWYDGKVFFSTADAVDISGGGTFTNVNASMERKGVISGTVTFDGGSPAAGVFVDVYNAYGKQVAWGGPTNASGQYTVQPPYPGAHGYFVRFGGNPNMVTEWYQDQDSLDAATPVTVTAGTTTTINASVAAAGWITGVVTDAVTGLPLAWVAEANVYDQSGYQVGSAWTDGSGVYAVGGLGTGYYRVRFSDGAGNYETEYYDDQSTLDLATLVSVTAGITTPNVSAALSPTVPTPTGWVTGTVTKNGGNPLGGGDTVEVRFYDAGTGQFSTAAWLGGVSDYVQAVPSGTYKVLFFPQWIALAPEWYSDTASMAGAALVTVTTGITTTDVNADMGPATGCISGVVTANVAGANPDVEVQSYYTDALLANPPTVKMALTGSDGMYTLCDLKGNYLLGFFKNPYIPEWYDDAPSAAGADAVSVTNGVTSTANATLTLGGCVSGKVTDISGQPQVVAAVNVYDSAGNRLSFYQEGQNWLVQGSGVNDDGSFVLCGFPTGNYTIWCGIGTAEWLQGTVPVTITAGQETSGVTCVVAVRVYLPLVLRSSGS